jgi:hypothetical protein
MQLIKDSISGDTGLVFLARQPVIPPPASPAERAAWIHLAPLLSIATAYLCIMPARPSCEAPEEDGVGTAHRASNGLSTGIPRACFQDWQVILSPLPGLGT